MMGVCESLCRLRRQTALLFYEIREDPKGAGGGFSVGVDGSERRVAQGQ